MSAAEDGRFLLEDVFPGRLGLRVSAEGFQTAEVAELEVLPGKDLEGVVVTLEPGGTVTGRVLDSAGEPASGATVELVRDQRAGRIFSPGANRRR